MGYRVVLSWGIIPTKSTHGREYFQLSDFPTGVTPGCHQLLFIDPAGKPTHSDHLWVQVELETADAPPAAPSPESQESAGFQSIEDRVDAESKEAIDDDYIDQANKLALRDQRLDVAAKARAISRTDALLETAHAMLSDTLSRVPQIDEMTRRHFEAQIALTERMLETVRRLEPQQHTNWAEMISTITGHLTTVVTTAMQSRHGGAAFPGGVSRGALPEPSDKMDRMLVAIEEIARKSSREEKKAKGGKMRKRLERLEAMIDRLLSRRDRDDSDPPPPSPPPSASVSGSKAEKFTAAEPVAPAPEPVAPASKPVAPASEPVAPASEPVAPAAEPAAPAPEPAAPASKPVAPASEPASAPAAPTAKPSEAAVKRDSAEPVNPYQSAWRRMKRTIASITDGEITMFVCEPRMLILYLGYLASLAPAGAAPC